jgi:flagellar hook protein FlgE
MSTALTGLNASETQIDVIGNNLANANTVGFKASDVLFANQFLQTQSVGSAPTATNGGSNPQQQGLGVEVAEIMPNFTQGTISSANSPTDLAIQGDGFFIVQGQNGQQNYTRNGTFTANANNQLVTGTGNLVMGFGVNSAFQVDTSHLQPLSIPLGTAMVAKATTEATLQGSLTSSGEIANTAAIIQTNPLTDANIEAPASGPTLNSAPDPNNTGLTGTYSYYVTYVNNNTNVQSRPQPVAVTSTSLDDDMVTLTNFPIPTNPSQWTGMTVYRSVNSPAGDSNFYPLPNATNIPLATAAAPVTVTDDTSDATLISDATTSGASTLNFNGPAAIPGTLLYNLLEYDSTTETYQNVFPISAAQKASIPANPQAPPVTLGTLSFTGTKNGAALTTQTFTITSNTTLSDLATFMQGSVGIQQPPGNDPNNPIPLDAGTGAKAGASITPDGRIKLVSNDGTPNAVGIPLSALQWTPASNTPSTSAGTSTTSAVNLPFNQIQAANGQGTSTSMVAYDSLGTPLSVTLTAVLESRNADGTTYRWYADCGQNDNGTNPENIAVGTGTVTFGDNGALIAESNTTVSINRDGEPSINPLQFNLNFSQVSGLSTSAASLAVASQDGSPPGVLNSFNISGSGLINGVFSNGISQNLGQIQLARFTNPAGLEQMGQNMYAAGVNSGLPIISNPGQSGNGTIVAGSLELSNTDIGASLINLITTSTMYQSNTRVITTATQLFDDLLQLGR